MPVIIQNGWYVPRSSGAESFPEFGLELRGYSDLLLKGLENLGFPEDRIRDAKSIDMSKLYRLSLVADDHVRTAIKSFLILNFSGLSQIASYTGWNINANPATPDCPNVIVTIGEDENCPGLVNHIADLFKAAGKLAGGLKGGKPKKIPDVNFQTFEDLRAGFEGAIRYHLELPLIPAGSLIRNHKPEKALK